MQRWRLLLTRTAPDCQLQANHLRQLGITAETLPLMNIASLPETQEQRSQLLDFDRYTSLIVISKPAARLILERLDYYWPQLPINQTWFSVGKATADILQVAGLTAYHPKEGDNSEALWQLEEFQQQLKTPNCRILLIKGQEGRTWLTEQLQLKGIATETIDLYRRLPNHITENDFWKKITDAHLNAIVISSGQSLIYLHHIVKKNWQQLAQLTLLVPSERLAAQAKKLGIKRIINCNGASLGALITTLNTQQCH